MGPFSGFMLWDFPFIVHWLGWQFNAPCWEANKLARETRYETQLLRFRRKPTRYWFPPTGDGVNFHTSWQTPSKLASKIAGLRMGPLAVIGRFADGSIGLKWLFSMFDLTLRLVSHL